MEEIVEQIPCTDEYEFLADPEQIAEPHEEIITISDDVHVVDIMREPEHVEPDED